MKKKFSFFSWINIAYCLAFVFCFKVTLTEAQTNLPGQTISVANSPVGISGENVLLEISYDTTDANNGLSGIGFRIHYDSSLLTFSHSQNALNFGLIVDAVGPYTDDYDLDNNPNTDNYISFGWTVLLNNWPSTSLPIVITQVVFTVNDLTNLSAISSTNINFTDISTSASHRFVATDYEMELITATWDVDGNEHADALTDGLILLRHAFELRGNDVTDGAIASNSSFSNFQVEQAIERTMQISDIDDNGEVDALTDILILLRYLFGLRGDGLIDGAVPENAERTTATEIEDYIANHMHMPNEENSNLDYESVQYENLAGTWILGSSEEDNDQVTASVGFMEIVFSRFGHMSFYYEVHEEEGDTISEIVECFGGYTLNESELNAMLGCREGDDVFFDTQISGLVGDGSINLGSAVFAAISNEDYVTFFNAEYNDYEYYTNIEYLTNIQPGIYSIDGISNVYLEISASGQINVTGNNAGGCNITGYIKTDPSYGLSVQNFNEIPLIDNHVAILDITNCYYEDDGWSPYHYANINDSDQPVIIRSYYSSYIEGHQIEFFAPGNTEVDNVVNVFWLVLSLACSEDENCSHIINEDEQPSIESIPPPPDGVPPQLLEFTAINKCNNLPKIAKDDVLKIDIKATESLLTPVAEINGDEFQMTGQHNTWSLEHPLTNIDGLVNEGNISLVIKYKDTSGMNGSDAELPIGSELTFCDSENTSCTCFPESIEGVWKNANRINAMGVGPVEGSTEYWRVDGFELGRRACQFDDTYTFTADENAQSGGGLFSQEMDNNTWLEGWASPTGSESCGDPTLLENYPWDGLETGHSYIWNPEEAELSVLGEGAHIGIPRVTNGGDASTDGPASIITYSVATASFCDLALNIYAAGDLWWHFELERVSFPDPDNANIQYSLEDYPDYCSLGPDMFGSDLVVDMFGPVITISGDNPVLAVSGDAFVPPSATAYDVFDNATFIVNNIASNVDTSTPGTYTVIYTASDTSGNETTKNLTVIVEPDYQDEIVLFSNGSLADGWRQNGYDVDLSYGDCPGNTCPNLDYGIENDPIKGRDVMFIDHLGDNAAQAGFFMQTELNVDPIDLRGAEVNGKLSFEIWSDSPDGVDLNVAVDCPAYPNAGSPVLLEGVGPQQWQEISIPASSLFNESCASRSDEIGTINMFLSNWMGPKIRIDNVRWLCELSCNGSDIPDAVYTPWVKADKTVGFDAPNSYPGYNLVWSDEFDGTAVDQTKWNLVNAGGGFGNSELQYYRPENAAVEDGLLVITADIQQSDDAELPGGESFSSAKLTTQDKLEFKHGRVDIRAAVAEGKGFWSAAWMLGANVDDIGWPFAGEIDIVETIGGVHYGVDQENRMVHNAYWNAEGPFAPSQYLFPRQYQVAKYSPTPSGQSTAWGERKLLTEGETFSNTFHVFSIEWDEEKIRYMIDGVYVEGRDLDLTTNVVSLCPHGQVANEPQLSCLGQSYDNDFFLILNVAVGGTFPGAPDSTTQFPRGMLVDYVRVYQTADQQAAQ